MSGHGKAIDLFCGCGGLTEGLRQAGFDVIGAIDNDPHAVATYRVNHPKTVIWATDITTVSPADVLNQLGLKQGELDLLAGCPPCQGFSVLSSKNGRHDQSSDWRNDLIFDFLRFVVEMNPKAVMLENVPGLYTDARFLKVRQMLESLGYFNDARIVDAADYGVPQRRRRLVLIARRDAIPAFAVTDPDSKTVRSAIGTLAAPGFSGDSAHDIEEHRSERIQALIKAIPTDGGSRSSLPSDQVLACHKKVTGFKDVYGRMAWDGLAPTITTGCFNPSRGRFLHPEQNRAITLREAALLQSFPKSYLFPKFGKQVLARLIGNALPPELIRRLARSAFDGLTTREGSA